MMADAATIEELIVSLPLPDDPRLSPDGRRVVWAAAPEGKVGDHLQGALWLASVDGSTSAVQFTSGVAHDFHPRWSPDGRAIAFLSDRSKPGITGLWLIDSEGGEARPLAVRQRSVESFTWSPDGRRIAFLAPEEPTTEDERRERERDDAEVYGARWPYNRLHLLQVDDLSVTTLPVGDLHVTEIAWSPDGTRLAFVAAPTPELETRGRPEVRMVVVDGGAVTEVCTAPGWGIDRLQWTKGGTQLLFGSSHEPAPQGSATVYAVDADDGTPRVVGPAGNEEACATGLVVGARVGPVAAIARGLTTHLEQIDVAAAERRTLLALERGDIAAFDVGLCGSEVVVAAVRSGGSEPPEVWAGPPAMLRRLSDHHAPLGAYTFGTQEPFFWQAPDGLRLDGVLILPPGRSERPLPTVVLVHGGPYSRTSDGWNLRPQSWGQWLAEKGYAVLMPNYRGGAGHGNRFAVTARGAVGLGDFGDVMSAVDAAIQRGIADPERLGIGGWSQGGFMTAWAITQTDRFKAAVMGAGVSDWGMMTLTSDLPTFESVLGGSRPWDGVGPHQHARISPISYATRAKTPTLILHGKNDARVPVTQAIGFARALREASTTVELVVYPREPHRIGERTHQLDLLRRVRAWYDRWLGDS